MNSKEPIRELIDACRPGSDDLRLPEMEELAELVDRDPSVAALLGRSQRFDQAIAAAMGAGDVPEGLEARLLAAVADAGASAGDDASNASENHETAGQVEAAGRERAARRRWLWAASLAAAAAVIGVVAGGIGWWLPRPSLERTRIADAADRWLDQLIVSEGVWGKDVENRVLAAYPASSFLKSKPSAWRRFEADVLQGSDSLALDRNAVVYDLRGNVGELRTMLFVVRTSVAVEAPDIAPRTPTRVTGGWSIGVWREGDLVYVLAVEGDEDRYRTFVKPAPRLA